MKTWICNIMCNIYGPLLGAARLYPYVKKQGFDISFKDLNQDSYFSVLSKENLGPVMDRVRYAVDTMARNIYLREEMGSIALRSSNNALRQLISRQILSHYGWYKPIEKIGVIRKPLAAFAASKVNEKNIIYALLSEKESVLTAIERSRKILDERFFDLETNEFLSHFQTLLGGKALIDLAYFPAQIDFGLGFNGNAYNPRTKDIIHGVEDEKHNFLIPYYRRKILPMVEAEHPGVVGISVTCVYELIPAFTLAHMIKKASPQTHIVLGGVFATQLANRIAKNTPLWNMFDSLVLGPGEVAFTELIAQVEKGGSLAAVPNLIYRQKDAIMTSEKTHDFDINDACTPEFVSLRPRSGLPLETSSGCYWGKCIFCYYPKAGTADHDPMYQKKRVRRMELVLQDIKEYKEKYNPIGIVFSDSSFHPKRMEAVVEDNVRNGYNLKFYALFRMEKEFNSKAFCRKLAEGGFLGGFVGLESGSQRVNDIINKGIDLENNGIIFKNFNDTGIMVHLFSIIGIPGETREDALMTYKYIKRWRRYLKLYWVIYHLYLTEHSALANRAEEFKLKSSPLPDDYLVPFMSYQPEDGLSQEASTSLSITLTEKLNRMMHPLNRIMDVESMVLFFLAQRSKGVMPDKVKLPGG
jgi:anaerobic magnesium-protoporphyrin IX monomethyl ester cyclase